MLAALANDLGGLQQALGPPRHAHASPPYITRFSEKYTADDDGRVVAGEQVFHSGLRRARGRGGGMRRGSSCQPARPSAGLGQGAGET